MTCWRRCPLRMTMDDARSSVIPWMGQRNPAAVDRWYPLVNVTIFDGKTHYKWPFSIAFCMFSRPGKHPMILDGFQPR